jgi:nucleotide-binding universal stress UspA family protein
MTMFEKILVATDFSNYAGKILDCVSEIPGAKELVLLHVLTKDPLARTWSPGDERQKVVKRLEADKKVLEEAGLKVKTIVEYAEEIKEYEIIDRVANRENVSLVVMGARGRGLWEGMLLGSVSTDYLRYGSKDLLIMRYKTLGSADKAELAKFCSFIFEKVLCPTDFSEAGNAAIERIKARKLTKNLLLLNVVAKVESQAQLDAELKSSQEKLEAMKTDLASAGITVKTVSLFASAGEPRTYGSGGMVSVKTTPFASIGGIVEKILSVAEGEDVSLIALGSHGKGWLDQATIGSVVSDVARMGTRPVLVIRSQKKT